VRAHEIHSRATRDDRDRKIATAVDDLVERTVAADDDELLGVGVACGARQVARLARKEDLALQPELA
jgi:hypothetical protein